VDDFGGWAIVSACYLRGDQGGVACHLPSTTPSIGDLVQRGLDNGCGMMDARKVVAPSGVVVVLTACMCNGMRLEFSRPVSAPN
jgi:hypothetical protein